MSANKTNVNCFYSELYNDNKSVIVAFDIENIVLVTHIINAIKRTLYICKTSPLCILRFLIPIF